MAMVFPSARSGRRRSRTSNRSRSSSGSTEWVASTSYITLTAGSVEVVPYALVPNSLIKTMTSPTYLGGHVEVLAMANASPPETIGQGSLALGICVLPERTFNASGAGLPADATIPLPFSDAEGDWPYHRMFSVSVTGTGGLVDASYSPTSAVRFHDVARSKRRLSEDDVVVGIIELYGTPLVPPTGQINVQLHTRLLLRQA